MSCDGPNRLGQSCVTAPAASALGATWNVVSALFSGLAGGASGRSSATGGAGSTNSPAGTRAAGNNTSASKANRRGQTVADIVPPRDGSIRAAASAHVNVGAPKAQEAVTP